MDESLAALDETVHQRVRLAILTICSEAKRVEFAYLREALDLTAGNLSAHLRVLEEAGLVTVDKTFERRRAKTWIALSRPGRAALRREIAALRAIADRVDAVAPQGVKVTAAAHAKS